MKSSFLSRYAGRAALLVGAFSLAVSAQTLTLKIDSAQYKIGRDLYGVLMENYGRDIYQSGIGGGIEVGPDSPIPNTNGIRTDIINAMRDAGISCIEWPGGCYADKYNWKNGLGPITSRPVAANKDSSLWLGTEEYFNLCKLTNANGYIAFNVQSSVANGGGWQNMVDWLNYIDTNALHPEWKTQLKYIKIGNEEWSPCGNMTQASYQAVVDTYYAHIPDAWKSRVSIIMDGGSGGGNITTNTKNEVGRINGQSLHYYAVSNWTSHDCPSIGYTPAQYYQKINLVYNIQSKITGYEGTSSMGGSDPNYTMGLMIDEWGIWCTAMTSLGGDYNQSAVMHSVATALNQNIMNNHCRRVKMALSAQPVNVIHTLFLTRPGRTDSALVKGAAYYVYKMMKVHQNAKMVPSVMTCGTVSSTPVLSASASVDSLNKLNITLVNINVDTAKTLTVTLSNPPSPYRSIGAQIVTGPTDSSYNDFNKPEVVNIQPFADSNYTLSGNTLTVKMPPHSVVQLLLSPDATGINAAPTVISPMSQLALKALPNGKVAVRYPAMQKTNVHWSLSSLDGRVIESSSTMMHAGQTEFVASLKHSGLGSKVYLMRVDAAGISKSLPVVLNK